MKWLTSSLEMLTALSQYHCIAIVVQIMRKMNFGLESGKI
jgi:hypothetical protein